MLVMRYFSFERIPVGMNVGHGHKNGHLQTLAMQDFVFENRFYHHNFAIGGCYNVVRIVRLEDSFGIAEEIGEENHQHRRCGQGCHEISAHPEITGRVDDNQS